MDYSIILTKKTVQKQTQNSIIYKKGMLKLFSMMTVSVRKVTFDGESSQILLLMKGNSRMRLRSQKDGGVSLSFIRSPLGVPLFACL